MALKSPIGSEAAELIAQRFRALSDPTRLRILDHLSSTDGASVRELTDAVESSQQNISKHLSTLRAEGFVARDRKGNNSIYRISDPAVLELCERVCGGIEAQLAELEAALRR